MKSQPAPLSLRLDQTSNIEPRYNPCVGANWGLALGSQDGLDAAEGFSAGAVGMQHLVEEGPESALDKENSQAIVWSLFGWLQGLRGQILGKENLELVAAHVLYLLDALFAGAQFGSELREKRCLLDHQRLMSIVISSQ